MARKPARHIQKAKPSAPSTASQLRIPYESKEYKEIQKSLRRLRQILL